ncbi:MAG: Ig-like domain-containing protein [Lachnospiraceae bacterium]|nr:Ig-like domain-containing protein [Lachnospiraceae bacterium]
MLLAFSLVMSLSVSNVSVQAKTTKKKIKLNKTKATLYVGETTKLKVKNTKKKVKWSSSKKKVATVDKKGKVKAKKAGKTTITAKVGKKKLKCKVTVKKKQTSANKTTNITVSSVSVLNSYTVQVGLSAAQSISAANFTVKAKVHEKGNYNITKTIESISTSDKRTYKITLGAGSGIEEGTYVQVTVKGLKGSGTVSKAVFFKAGTYQYASDTIYKTTKGASVSEYLYLSGFGYSTYTVSGLPEGLSAEMENEWGYIKFSGKAMKAGVYPVKLVTKDELGDSYTYNIKWLVGSEDYIAAGMNPTYGLLSERGDFTVYTQRIQIAGGSGSYTCDIEGQSHGIQVATDNSGPYMKGTVPAAGNYKIKVQVTDDNNPSLTTTFEYVLDIKQGVAVSGMIYDAKGNPFVSGYNRVNFENKDKANRYYSMGSGYAQTAGMYSEQVLPGTYDIYVTNSEGNLISETITVKLTASRVINFNMPVYPIAIQSDNEAISSSFFGKWVDDKGNNYGSGARLYLKQGTYHLRSDFTNYILNATAILDVTVNANTVSATAKVSGESAVVGAMKEDEPLKITVDSITKTYSFTPETKGIYYFWSEGDKDTYGTLCNSKGEKIKSNDDAGVSSNYYLSYECEAGNTYYIAVSLVYGNPGETTLHISATQPEFDS